MRTVLLILLAHFISDFIFQTDRQAIGKSTSNWWLSAHVATYSIGIACFGLIYVEHGWSLVCWISINSVLHWITDYFTSRLNSYLWTKGMRHWFFVGIGADQMIHYTCLLTSYEYIIK